MSEKSAMNVDLRDVQEKVEDGMQSAKNMGRKVVLASVGVWGLAYDKAQDFWERRHELRRQGREARRRA